MLYNIPLTVYYELNNLIERNEVIMNYDTKVANRLKRIEGQLRAVLRMMDEGSDCKDVITQLSAVRSGVDRTIGVIVTDNLVQCMQQVENDEEMNAVVKQAMDLVVKSR